MKMNDEKMRRLMEAALPEYLMMKDIIESNDILIEDVMRALYLLSNVKKLTHWGKVSFLVKNGQVVAVTQEQQFITSRELERVR